MFSGLKTGNLRIPPRTSAFLVFAGLPDAKVVVAGLQVDFLVRARLLFLGDRKILGFEIRVRSGFLDRSRGLERHRLLGLQHGLGNPLRAALYAVHGVIGAKIVESGRALGASALGAPFGLHHVGQTPVRFRWPRDGGSVRGRALP